MESTEEFSVCLNNEAQLLVNRLFKPAQEKVWLSELTDPQWP